MKLLETITHPDFPTPGIEIATREAARVVLVDEDGNVPLIYTAKHDVYKIPGGGVDPGEDYETAAKREAMEEVGCEIEILGEIGKIIEQRPAHGYSKGTNLEQTSYCYYGKVLKKGEVAMSESEIARGFERIWLPMGEVLEKMECAAPDIFKAQLVAERDKIVFKASLEIIMKNIS